MLASANEPTLQPWTLPLLRLVSPGLPIGGFAYSKGLEYAAHAGWVRDEASAREWIVGILTHTVAQLDAPLFVRLYDALAAGDLERAAHWNAIVRASRESQELALEDAQLGAALGRLLVSLDAVTREQWADLPDASYVAAFALAAVRWDIPRNAALQGYLWAILESQTSAAVRLIPLGQSAGQRILEAGLTALPGAIEAACALPDDELGAVAVSLAIGSALHETQYCRLFRS
ncbi:MAG TPA: urease accessory UreF family protein [Polyangiales bacterium]